MKKQLLLSLCLILTLVQLAGAQVLTLQPLLTFGPNGDGSMRPGQANGSTVVDFTPGGAERSIAYNPVTGHLLFVARTNIFSPFDYHIYVLDGATGTNIMVVTTNQDSTVSTNALELDVTSFLVSGGNMSFQYSMIGVGDDGAIYVANLSNASSPPQFRVYRWADEFSQEVCVYGGDPGNGNQATANRRWGDTLAVRGAGANTQILIASRGSLAAIIAPPVSGDPQTPFSWTSTTLQTDIPSAVGMGFGLCFGKGNTFYSKAAAASGTPLVYLSFDLNAGTATTIQTYSLTNFPGRIGNMNILPASNLLVGVEVVAGPDLVRLYDVSNTANAPVLQDHQYFTTNVANEIFAASVAFGANGTVYTLDTDNGLRAFTIVPALSNTLPPLFIAQPTNTTIYPNAQGVLPTNATFVGVADGTAPITYQWYQGTTLLAGQTNITLNVANPLVTDNGKTYSVVATNNYGAVTSTVATLGVTLNIPVTLPWYESFNEPVGSLSTNGGWYVQSGSSGNIVAGNLTVPGMVAPSGNQFAWPNTTMSDRLPFGAYSSGTLYYSIAIKVTNLTGLNNGASGTTPGVLCGFANGTGTTFLKLDIRTNTAAGQYNLGVSIGGTTVVYATNIFNLNDTVYVVMSYTFTGIANGDVANLWLNPDPATFGTATAPANLIAVSQTASAGNIALLDRFFFRFSGANQPNGILADELRMGLSWSDVTVPPIPALQITTSGSGSTKVSWPASASGFSLQGTTNLGSAAIWADVTNAITVVGTNNVVTINSSTNASRYFRLLK